MTKISFQLKFDTQVDLKNEFNDISKFLDYFFVKKISTNLVNSVEFSERICSNSVVCKTLSQEKFDSYGFSAFKETAKNTTKEIRNSIVYEVVATNGAIQDIDVSFSINYNIPESAEYCKSIDVYLKDCIIKPLVYQTKEMKELSERVNTKETPRVVKLDEHFLELLNQMEETLKIEQPKKALKM
jgi:hypothetical protein